MGEKVEFINVFGMLCKLYTGGVGDVTQTPCHNQRGGDLMWEGSNGEDLGRSGEGKPSPSYTTQLSAFGVSKNTNVIKMEDVFGLCTAPGLSVCLWGVLQLASRYRLQSETSSEDSQQLLRRIWNHISLRLYWFLPVDEWKGDFHTFLADCTRSRSEANLLVITRCFTVDFMAS